MIGLIDVLEVFAGADIKTQIDCLEKWINRVDNMIESDWNEYEQRKREIAATAQSTDEYQKRIMELAKEIGV